MNLSEALDVARELGFTVEQVRRKGELRAIHPALTRCVTFHSERKSAPRSLTTALRRVALCCCSDRTPKGDPLMKSLRSALVLTFLLAGCSFEVGDYQPRHALEEYRPASPHARIRSVSFGLGNGDKFDGTHIGTKLPETATQAMVWYEFKIGPQGTRVDVRWYMGDEKKPLLVQTERLDGSFGESAWALRTASGNPLPTGRYHVELVENGTVVTTIPFTVGDAS